jgi:hypothetical protein
MNKNRNLLLTSLLIFLLAFASVSGANRIKTWSDGNTLTADDLNAEYNNIYAGTIARSAGSWSSNDEIPVCFGTSGCSTDARIEWDAGGQTQDALVIFTGGANHVIIADIDDAGTDYGRAAATDPTLFIQSADEATTTDFISLAHDQTRGVIDVGGGNLSLAFAGASKVIVGASTGNYIAEGATDNDFETAISFTDPTADRTVTVPDADVTLQAGTTLVGPGAVTDNTVPAFDGTSGNTFQPTGVTIDDSDNIGGIANFTSTGTTSLNTVTYTWPGSDSTGTQYLASNGAGTLSWGTPGGAGNVVGPGPSVTDNTLARFDGTGGLTIQDSGIVVDDSDNISAIGTLATTGAATLASAAVTGALTANGAVTLGNAAADILTSSGTWAGASPFVFEGATGGADTNETTFAITDPTADRTVTFQDASGTVAYTSDVVADTVGDVNIASANSSESSGAYSTVLNYSSGGGYLEAVMCATANGDADVAYSGMNCNFRINIDGGGNQDLADIAIDSLFSADDVYTGFDNSTSDSYSARRIFLHARFESSCVVSVMQNSGGSANLIGVVHYLTDQ